MRCYDCKGVFFAEHVRIVDSEPKVICTDCAIEWVKKGEKVIDCSINEHWDLAKVKNYNEDCDKEGKKIEI